MSVAPYGVEINKTDFDNDDELLMTAKIKLAARLKGIAPATIDRLTIVSVQDNGRSVYVQLQ